MEWLPLKSDHSAVSETALWTMPASLLGVSSVATRRAVACGLAIETLTGCLGLHAHSLVTPTPMPPWACWIGLLSLSRYGLRGYPRSVRRLSNGRVLETG